MNIKGGIVMFCPNCGNKLKGNEKFCSNCGTKCNTIVNKKETLSETLAKKNPLIPLCNKVKNFILNNKKPVILGSCACLLIMIGLISFNIFYDFTKLSWDKDSDASISITSPTTLTLNVLAFDKEGNKITKIEFSTDAGDIESNGTSGAGRYSPFLSGTASGISLSDDRQQGGGGKDPAGRNVQRNHRTS